MTREDIEVILAQSIAAGLVDGSDVRACIESAQETVGSCVIYESLPSFIDLEVKNQVSAYYKGIVRVVKFRDLRPPPPGNPLRLSVQDTKDMIFLFGAWYAGLCYLANNIEALQRFPALKNLTKEMFEQNRDNIMQRLNSTLEVEDGSMVQVSKDDFSQMLLVFNLVTMILLGEEPYRKLRQDMIVAQDILGEVTLLSAKIIAEKFKRS